MSARVLLVGAVAYGVAATFAAVQSVKVAELFALALDSMTKDRLARSLPDPTEEPTT